MLPYLPYEWLRSIHQERIQAAQGRYPAYLDLNASLVDRPARRLALREWLRTLLLLRRGQRSEKYAPALTNATNTHTGLETLTRWQA
jgi:hypothetical protein